MHAEKKPLAAITEADLNKTNEEEEEEEDVEGKKTHRLTSNRVSIRQPNLLPKSTYLLSYKLHFTNNLRTFSRVK